MKLVEMVLLGRREILVSKALLEKWVKKVPMVQGVKTVKRVMMVFQGKLARKA